MLEDQQLHLSVTTAVQRHQKAPAEAGATLKAFSALRCCCGARDHDAERCWTRFGVHWQQPGLGVPWGASGDPVAR